MLIGEFARKSKLTRETIRFYEKEGLLEGVRKENNYRVYSEKEMKIVEFITSLKELGFTLPEIRNILSLYNSELKCREMQMILEVNLKKIEVKLNTLRTIQNNLLKSIKQCEQNPNKKSCIVFAKI